MSLILEFKEEQAHTHTHPLLLFVVPLQYITRTFLQEKHYLFSAIEIHSLKPIIPCLQFWCSVSMKLKLYTNIVLKGSRHHVGAGDMAYCMSVLCWRFISTSISGSLGSICIMNTEVRIKWKAVERSWAGGRDGAKDERVEHGGIPCKSTHPERRMSKEPLWTFCYVHLCMWDTEHNLSRYTSHHTFLFQICHM